MNMNHGFILENPHHFNNGVHLADMGEKFIAQPGAFRGPLDQSGNIHELHHRGNGFLGLGHLREFFQPLIGHRHNSDRRVNGAKRIILRRHTFFGKHIKKRGFPHVRQTDNSDG